MNYHELSGFRAKIPYLKSTASVQFDRNVRVFQVDHSHYLDCGVLFTDLIRMSYNHQKSTFYLRDVTFRILTGGLVINMVALLRFFRQKGMREK